MTPASYIPAGAPRAVGAAVPAGAETRNNALDLTILYLPFFAATFLAKFVVPVGTTEILVGLPFVFLASALGLMTGRLSLHPVRCSLFMMSMAVLVFLQFFNTGNFSLGSICLLVLLYSPFALRFNDSNVDMQVQLRRLLRLSAAFAIMGVVQFVAQFVIGPTLAFPIENFGPKAIVTSFYASLHPLSYGSKILESNGLFFAEPSTFSQYLAMMLSLELMTFRSIGRMMLYVAGLIVAMSGTGIIILCFTVPALIIYYRRFDLLVLLVIAMFVVASAADVIGLGHFTERAQEFAHPGSSGFARFVGGYYFFLQFLAPDPLKWLFGIGAGNMHQTGLGVGYMIDPMPAYPVATTGWIKIVAEYGLVGTLAFLTFFLTSLFKARGFFVVKITIALLPIVMGAFEPGLVCLAVCLLLWPRVPESVLELGRRRKSGASTHGDSVQEARGAAAAASGKTAR